MNETEKHALRKFYDRLRENLKTEKHKQDLVQDSVLITLLKTQSATRYRLLNKSALMSIDISAEGLSTLLDNGYVQSTGDFGSYVITAKGVWQFEHELGLLNEEKLLSYLTENYFTTKNQLPLSKNDLNDKERVILLAMIAARAFSKDSAADLKKSEVARDKWKDILGGSFDVLNGMGLVSKTEKTAFIHTRGNEHIANSVFRHNTHMLQKTQAIYRYTREYKYYLDLYNNGVFSSDKLSYLFWKIFQGNIAQPYVDQIADFCNEVSSKECIFLFDMSKHKFGMPTYDRILKDSLLESIRARDKWSKIP
jgi:hypothetical protein